MQRADLLGWDPYSQLQFQREAAQPHVALSLREATLRDELLRMRQQQLIRARKERREELRAKIQRLEKQVQDYQVQAGRNVSNPEYDDIHTAPHFAELEQLQPGSSENLVQRLVQQNELIMALLLPRKHDDARMLSSSENATKQSPQQVLDEPSPSKGVTTHTDTASALHSEVEYHSPHNLEPRKQKLVKSTPTFRTPPALSWLPEFEWTDEDELNNEDVPDLIGDVPNLKTGQHESQSTVTSIDTNTETLKDQKARDRLEVREKLEALLNASLKKSSAVRRPRWRLKYEADEDDITPFELEEADIMEPGQIFRASVLAVLFTIQLKNLLLAKKLVEKENETRAVLKVYFDATRLWLGKVVRTPLLSLLQDSSLDVDISTKSGVTGSSFRGFTKKFSHILIRRSPTPAQSRGYLNRSAIDQVRLLKLKVRVRGILLSLDKAIDREEVPSGILDFWKRISSDGVYFPPCIFNEERQHLEFDALGATRRMDFDDTLNQSDIERSEEVSDFPRFSRFNVVVINFLLIRILIPHVILQPWSVGIGPTTIGKQASVNLLNLATLLYGVCKQLSPLPLLSDPENVRQRSKTNTPYQPSKNDILPELTAPSSVDAAIEPNEEDANSTTTFLCIDEICRRLISDSCFPNADPQVIEVVKDQQILLNNTLAKLRSRLHA
ncbi:unnamed protein product [Phytophthora fragariaefolia]|uniref:Unnamed protein product n=1 Tax=Phytophthora fragariaefolia TaxID=1490495 RepID=A0A9W6XLG7_9STRA|nr:unnamed protein product [Phytophthora fragariaefolia]